MSPTEAYIALNMLPGIGAARLRRLLEVFETPDRVLVASGSELRGVPGIGRETAEAIVGWESRVDLAGEIKRIEERGITVLTADSPLYSPLLRRSPSPPIVLYCWGKLLPADLHAVGVVGSRRASHYGLESARKLGYQLAFGGYTVISGLAVGIDTAAHEGALSAHGRTIAILGSGLNKLYPRENRGLAERIADGRGAIITEFPMETPADTQTFPMRNRIVAAWGAAVLVVEAAHGSGALITATQAIEQGRPVYAVPGQIDKPSAAGSNRLIQQGARLVTCAADIIDDLGALIPRAAHEQAIPAATRAVALKPEEQAVYDAIGNDETQIDTIITRSQLPSGRVTSMLLTLEMKRMVKQLPGQYFVKLS